MKADQQLHVQDEEFKSSRSSTPVRRFCGIGSQRLRCDTRADNPVDDSLP